MTEQSLAIARKVWYNMSHTRSILYRETVPPTAEESEDKMQKQNILGTYEDFRIGSQTFIDRCTQKITEHMRSVKGSELLSVCLDDEAERVWIAIDEEPNVEFEMDPEDQYLEDLQSMGYDVSHLTDEDLFRERCRGLFLELNGYLYLHLRKPDPISYKYVYRLGDEKIDYGSTTLYDTYEECLNAIREEYSRGECEESDVRITKVKNALKYAYFECETWCYEDYQDQLG
ncbi:MAG: hypothetical protein NC084_04205 [Bacteroides sp.]|nr:hypothetical protein [Eubacterium sp.]MCM1417631.1 hypothetical protein [Roseburia sp.]MCM1461904.1 hypothetical protein [Bacteroides sp.]